MEAEVTMIIRLTLLFFFWACLKDSLFSSFLCTYKAHLQLLWIISVWSAPKGSNWPDQSITVFIYNMSLLLWGFGYLYWRPALVGYSYVTLYQTSINIAKLQERSVRNGNWYIVEELSDAFPGPPSMHIVPIGLGATFRPLLAWAMS